MPAPAAVGRKLFASYFSTDPTKIAASLALFTGLTPAQQNHVLGHLLYMLLLQLGRMDVAQSKILEAVEEALDQVADTLQQGEPELPPHLKAGAAGDADEDNDGEGEGDEDKDEDEDGGEDEDGEAGPADDADADGD